MKRASVLALVLTLVAIHCGHKKRVPAVKAIPKPVGAVETGVASWYGHPYHGRASASGEIYDMERMTAAHRTLPFGTWVRVRNLDNARTVDVRINDRGPFFDGRVIDVSRAAAEAIGLLVPGTAKVRLEVIAAPAIAASDYFAVQVGAYRDRGNAERVARDMEQQYGSVRLILREGNPSVWRVLVGLEATQEGASALAERLRRAGSKEEFIVRVDAGSPMP